MAVEMCNCVPFFYPFVNVSGPSCNPAGFECLFDFKWPIWASHTCKCPSTCIEIEYTIQTVKKSFWGNKLSEDGAKADVTSSFRWDLIPPKVRMRRDVVFSFEDLLVSFGGVLALFLGFSILSITRLAFVLTFHILKMVFEIIMLLRNNLKRIIRHCKQYRNRKVQEDVKTPQFINQICCGKVPLAWKWNLFTAIHQKLSKEENLEDKMEKNNGANNLDDTSVQPEFEYIN